MLKVLEMMEVMRCVLLCILDAVEGRCCLLEVMYCALLCLLEVLWRVGKYSVVALASKGKRPPKAAAKASGFGSEFTVKPIVDGKFSKGLGRDASLSFPAAFDLVKS